MASLTIDYTGAAIFLVLSSVLVAFIALKVKGREKLFQKGQKVSTVWLRLSQR